MSFLSNVFGTKPQPQPQQKENIDHQQVKRLAAIEAAKLQQADDTRRRSLQHSIADEERRKLNDRREALIAERKKSGKPLAPLEIRILDAEIEVELAERAFARDPGEPHIFGDGTTGISKPQSRVNAAKRALKSAEDALFRMKQMLNIPAAETYVAPVDVSGYFDHRKHMADVLASHGIK